MKNKILNIIKKIFVMCVISLILYFFFILNMNEDGYIDKIQYMNSIDYQVTINQNGSMTVVETWDIYVKNTNTLFKTFDLDPFKYSGITDVKVKEITNGINKNFSKINNYMYHVTKDCYYALNTSSQEFEIAWGINVNNRICKKEISNFVYCKRHSYRL